MPVPPRPRLKSHARPLRRGAGRVQLGEQHDVGVVLDGVSDAEVELLERLDGSLDLPRLYAAAARAGVAGDRLGVLLRLLRDRSLLAEGAEPGPGDADAISAAYGLVDDGLTQLRRRGGQQVLVSGCGSLPAAVARLLRAGGVGQVRAGLLAAEAADFELRRRDREHPDLVVLVAAGVLRSQVGEPWRRRGVPHLPVVAHGHRLAVGPLVLPGGACLGCLHLHRGDRDRAWPALLTQLAPDAVGPPAPVDPPAPLTALGAGLVAMVAHAHLDGAPVPAELSIEVGLPWPGVDYRRWTPHPRCHCRAAAGSAAGSAVGSAAGGAAGGPAGGAASDVGDLARPDRGRG